MSMSFSGHPLDGFTSPEPLLVIGDDASAADLAPAGATFTTLAGTTDIGRGWKSVLWTTADRASLRRNASRISRVGQTRVVALWLTDATEPLVVVPRPEWPALTSLMAREAGRGVLTVLRFAQPVGAHVVLTELARQAVPGVDTAHGGVVVAYAGREPAAGLDVRTQLLSDPAEAADEEVVVPADVVVTDGALQEIPVHHVIDRAPTLVTDPGLEPVDEMVVNPRGWRKEWTEPVRDLAPDQAVTEAAIAALRDVQGLRVDLTTADPCVVARLAAAGVPLLTSGASPVLGTTLQHALEAQPDLDDALAREEHSVTVRRAALLEHSTVAWRGRLAARAGVRHVARPQVSVLLTTMRPHQLDFALRQLARQRDADFELVLATHGWEADEAQVRAALPGREVVLVPRGTDTFFGYVLNDAFEAASGDVLLKVDDDDWYGPHAVVDLLLARRYSGADVVGMPSEFVHLAELGITTRRNHPTEIFNRFVAGGTIMADREVVRSVGGFRPVRRFVDAQLLSGIEAAGGRIYRTHGLGYVLRRLASGHHTWQVEADSFRKEGIVDREWTGFHASRELEADERDLP
ncbi:glycosyltransferase [Nocardioides sediminis]|uniref:glycosyltransferase n=1 Tax=Nocardioides sediminis TaxID=433648 RepID=UPI00131F4599|nr:glycosyltransferase [Nocardioides sediminis]